MEKNYPKMIWGFLSSKNRKIDGFENPVKCMNDWVDIVSKRLIYLNEQFSKIKLIDIRGGIYSDAYDELLNHRAKLLRVLFEVSEIDCWLRCGAICCHFQRDGPTVRISKSILPKLKDHLERNGDCLSEHIVRKLYSEFEPDLEDCYMDEDYKFIEGGEEFFYELRTKDVAIDERALNHLPNFWDGRLLWTDKNCYACTFLTGENRCGIYDSGAVPDTCKEFICSTCISLSLSKAMGYLIDEDIKALDFGDIRYFSHNITFAFSSGGLLELEMDRDEAFRSFFDDYITGHLTEEKLERYRDFERRYYLQRARIFKKRIRPGIKDFLIQLLP